MQIVTWNTQWCRGLDGRVDPVRIVDAARALADFDVLCLQEVAQGFESMPGAPGDQPMQLRAALEAIRPGERWHCLYAPAVDVRGPDGRPRRFGNFIATCLAPLVVERHLLPWPGDPAAPSMPRGCLAVTLAAPGIGALRVMTTHLEYYSAPMRLAQARALRALQRDAALRAERPPATAGEDPDGPFALPPQTSLALLCGDFNATVADPAYAALVAPAAVDDPPGADFVDAWPALHPGIAQPSTFRCHDTTWGRDPVAVDFAFVSRTLAPFLRAIGVDGDVRASDHQPVSLTLAG